MADLEPKWVVDLEGWWAGLLGPALNGWWDKLRDKAGQPATLESTYGRSVRLFEEQLIHLHNDVRVFESHAGRGGVWAPFADRARAVADRIDAQWVDPSSTMPLESVDGRIDAVMRGINVAVTVIGMAWALASLVEVRRMRRLLRQWSDHIAEGVHPSKRDLRLARIDGVDRGDGAPRERIPFWRHGQQARSGHQVAGSGAMPHDAYTGDDSGVSFNYPGQDCAYAQE